MPASMKPRPTRSTSARSPTPVRTRSSWIVHWGDGASNTFTSGGGKTHVYADGPNTFAITVDLVDEDGTFLNRANALSVTVNNVAPTIAISGNASVNEGLTYTLNL